MQKVEGKNPLHRLRGYHLFVGISVSDLGFDVYSSRYTPMKFLVFLLIPAFSFAQHQHSSDPDSARFDLAKLPAPQPMSGMGQAHIAITTSSPAAQRWFDQGLAALHCFWDYEALRAFEQAVRLDEKVPPLPRSYIYCRRIGPVDVFRQFLERAQRESGWRHFEIDASHNPHITCPDALMALLSQIMKAK